MSAGAAIAAAAAVTPFGVGVGPLWRGLLSGRGQVKPQPRPEGGDDPVTAALVPPAAFEGRADEDRTLALVRLAAGELLEDPAWARVDPRRLGICLGTTQGAITRWTQHQRRLAAQPAGTQPPPWPWLADPARLLAEITGAQGPVECPSMACVSGTAALGMGLQWLRQGRCRWVVAGGVDAFSDFVHAGFTALKAVDPERPRPFDLRRRGLGAGEGIGLLLLEADTLEGAPRLLGWGLGGDANHLTGPHPEGQGLARAITAALRDAGVGPGDLAHINAHGTATRFNDLMEAHALHRALGPAASTLPVTSVKGAIGHSMAAAGAVEAAASCQSLLHGQVPPTAGLEQQDPEIDLDVVQGAPRSGRFSTVLSMSAGFGGLNAAVIIG